MAASAMTPKLLDRISNKEYQEKDKWKIDDIALGPANELLISGHNLEIPEAFVSMHKEDSGKYDNRPEFNQNFDQTQPGEQLVMFLEGSPIIGLKVESALRLVTIKDMGVLKTLKWKRAPTCVCFYRGKLYAASSSQTGVNVCNLDSEEKSYIILSDMKSDRVLEIVVAMEKIYVCTKNAGRALVFSMTGSKEMEFKNPVQTDAMATSICIHERTKLVFVLWNNIKIQLYSQMTSQCLRALDMTENLHKIRVTTENLLVTLSASKCIVSVYDVGEAIKFGESQNTILSVKKKHEKKLISHDEENLDSHPADFETLSFPRKSASEQSKVEKVRDTKELYMKQLTENENLRRQYDRDVQKLYERIEELEGKRTKPQSRKKNLEYRLIKEKEKIPCKERPQFKISDRISIEGITRSIEADQGTIHESVAVAAREEIEQAKLNEKIKRIKEDLEDTRTKSKRQQTNLKCSLVNEPEKVPPGERIQINVKERVRTIKGTATSNENVQETIHEGVAPAVSEEISQTKGSYQSSNKGSIMKDTVAVMTENMETGLTGLIAEIFDDAMELTKQKSDVEEELETAKSTLKKKTADCSQIQAKLDAAMLEKNDLEETFTKTEELYRNIGAKEKEIEQLRMRLNKAQTEVDKAKMQVAILQSRKQELEKSLSREHERSDELIRLLSKVYACSTDYNKKTAQLEGANNRLEMECVIAEETQTLVSDLNKKIKDLEEMRTQLESEQMKLKDTLTQEKDKVTRSERSRVQLNERITDQEDMRTELESQQKKLRNILDQEKDKVTRAEGSRIQAENARKTLEQTIAMLEKEKEYLTKLLAAGERNETELKKSLEKATTTCEKLQEANEVLQREKEDLSEQLSTEKINKEIQIASFSKMTSHASPGSEKMAQRKDEDSYLCDETQSVITESTDSGRGSMHSGLEYHDPFILNGRQLKTELKVAVTVASKGANMHIPDTGVELDITAGAVRGKVLIEMIILPFDKLDAPVSTFSCNSSVAVELLPNKMEFHRPVRLILPHCLKLTKNYKKTKNQVKVYVSHHETGPPIWEEVSNAKYVLNETNCVIFVKSFCWVKYEVNNKIVDAKRIKAYTAGKRLKYTEDSLAEIEVGYHWDLPNARENLSMSDNMFVYQSKPFIYVKDGNLPLEIFLTKSVPNQWKYITPEDNPKVISFKCVADSKEKTCPFVMEKSEPTDRMPFCMFKVQQGNEDLELYIRFDD